jgi:putative glutamine amidotransferase
MTQSPCLVWLPMDHRLLGDAPHQKPYLILGEKYARAVRDAATVQPVLFPLVEERDMLALLDRVDGVMLTGSPSNVHPSHFNEELSDSDMLLDADRDALTLQLVRACVEKQVPLLGLCRGFQEINVAMGGTLHQQVHQVSGMTDHRELASESTDQQYAPRHELHLTKDALLADCAGAESVWVNSLHTQGIKQLAPGLRTLAVAPDGLIEAFEVDGASTFTLGVQWHPEWKCMDTPFYLAIFKRFGEACRARQRARSA